MRLVAEVINSGSIPTLEAMIRFTSARHKLIVNNIANVDTPGFRATDLDVRSFEKTLARAVSSRRPGEPLAFKGSRSVRGSGGDPWFKVVERFGDSPLRHDGNNVSIDAEMGTLYKNAATARIMTRLLAGRYRMLRAAVRGRSR